MALLTYCIIQGFGGVPQLELLKELFIQVFSTPYYHPKSKPFIDHIMHFGIMDNRIWFRNYQVKMCTVHVYECVESCTENGFAV